MAAEFRGTALDGAEEVFVDERGRVRSVRLDPQIVRRVGPDQVERSLVAARAAARAAAWDRGRGHELGLFRAAERDRPRGRGLRRRAYQGTGHRRQFFNDVPGHRNTGLRNIGDILAGRRTSH